MGWVAGAVSGASGMMGKATGMVGSIVGAVRQGQAAVDAEAAARTSKILEAAFFDDEVNSIIAESARLVGGAEAEAGVRGVKSTTGTAATRVAEIRMAGQRELRTAAQETVLTQHGFEQDIHKAKIAGKAARTSGILAALGGSAQVGSQALSSASRGHFGPRAERWVGKL